MKKVLALVLLVATATQANELKKAWNNLENELKKSWNDFEKDNRAISGGKALAAGYLTYASARHVYEQLKACSYVYKAGGFYEPFDEVHLGYKSKNDFSFYGSNKAEILPRQGILAGFFSYATYLFLKQAWHNGKHALGQDKKEKQTTSTDQANESKKEWNNFGKDNRAISGGRALLASGFCYTALRQLFLDGSFLREFVSTCWNPERDWEKLSWDRLTSDYEWWVDEDHYQGSKMIEIIPRKILMMGICTGVSYVAFKQAWHDAKKVVLGQDKKAEQIASTAQVNEPKKTLRKR